MGITKKVTSGLFWTLSQQFSSQFISFFVSILLARILSPAEFGLIGMLSIFIAVGNSLMDTGMTSSLIRTQDADQEDYSTVFVINMLSSVFIYFLIFIAAPYIASFYGQPILKDLVRIYSLSFIFSAFRGVQAAKLTKEMKFKVQMMIQIPSVIGGGIVGVVLAYLGYGVWSLVYMNVFQAFLFSIQHWFYSGWRPSISFNSEKFKHHFNFGYKLTLSGLIGTVYQNIFTLIIGKYFSVAQLGYYTRAFSLRQLPITNLSSALGKVTYPLFSKINNDDTKLKDVYRRLIQQVIFWIVPLLTLLIVVAEPMFRFLFTEKWLPAVPYFQILCVSGMLFPLQSYNYNIIKVKGRTDISLKMQVVKKVFGIAGIFCALPFGIYGLLYFQLISAIFDYYLDAYYGGKMIKYSMLEQIKDIFPSVSLAFVVGAGAWLLDSFLYSSYLLSDFFRLLIVSLFYFSTYLGISHLIKLSAALDFRKLILNRNNF